MCKALEYLDELTSIHTKLKADYNLLTKKQTELDRKLNEKYHQLEQATFNACDGYHFAKEIQDILQERRLVKNELQKLNSLNSRLNLLKLGEKINKTKESLSRIHEENKRFTAKFKVTLERVYGREDANESQPVC